MNTFSDSFSVATGLVAHLDPKLLEIIGLSLRVSLTATLLAACIGLPLGAALAVGKFPGRHALTVVVNACMGLPPVVVGLVVYLLLSRSGPLGAFGILFTPAAMIVAQTVLITPIIAALSRQIVADAWGEYREQLTSLGAGTVSAVFTLLWEQAHQSTHFTTSEFLTKDYIIAIFLITTGIFAINSFQFASHE